MAGALKEMQSDGKADQVFHLISDINGSLEKEKDVQPLIKVTTLPSWDVFSFFDYSIVIYVLL